VAAAPGSPPGRRPSATVLLRGCRWRYTSSLRISCRRPSGPARVGPCNSPVSAENGDFEEPILRLKRRLEELAALPDDAAHRREIEKVREKLDKVSREIYSSLTPWQKTLVARHPARPYPLDYILAPTTDFVELH